jgi:hypothetical protein
VDCEAYREDTVKHTDGPWKHEKSTKTIRSAKENYWIATMNSWDGAVDTDANARLIAAAPTMAAYLERKAAEGDTEAKTILNTID